MLLTGGADYEYMCSSCHLKPGQIESDMSLGLYPAPPNLVVSGDSHKGHEHGDDMDTARKNFWVIMGLKHQECLLGVKRMMISEYGQW